jgi:hypothetical protein
MSSDALADRMLSADPLGVGGESVEMAISGEAK